MNPKSISRRNLLKTALAAAGGLTAAAFLPGRWTKPLLQTGVVPAHAQASDLYTLTPNVDPSSGLVANGRAFDPHAIVTYTSSGLPADGVTVTMSSQIISAPDTKPGKQLTPSGLYFVPSLPSNATSGSGFSAAFVPTQVYNSSGSRIYFQLVFSAAGAANATAGPYYINPLIIPLT